MDNCAQCGTPLRGRFCANCGAPAPAPQAASQPKSITLPEGDWLVAVIHEAIPAGTTVSTPPGFRAYGFNGRESWAADAAKKKPEQIAWALDAGNSPTPAPCDLYCYVRDGGVPIKTEYRVRNVTGPQGPQECQVQLDGMSRVWDVLKIATGLGLSKGLAAGDAADSLALQPIELLIQALLREQTASGAWTLAGLQSGQQMPDFCRAIEYFHNTTDRIDKNIAGLGLQILNARISA